jgi:hypothetical protein
VAAICNGHPLRESFKTLAVFGPRIRQSLPSSMPTPIS